MINTLNLLTSPRWLALLPYKSIDKTSSIDTIAFNLTSFSLSELTIASNQTGYLAYTVDVPAYVRNQDKSITFSYLMDSSMIQYKYLYDWFSKIAVEEGSGLKPGTKWEEFAVPFRVFILSEFKKPVMEILYENSWIYSIGRIEMSYQDSNAPIISHSFGIKYSKISFNMEPTFG
jgi:hypothetical protein